jgi:hypothetical protein
MVSLRFSETGCLGQAVGSPYDCLGTLLRALSSSTRPKIRNAGDSRCFGYRMYKPLRITRGLVFALWTPSDSSNGESPGELGMTCKNGTGWVEFKEGKYRSVWYLPP